MVRFRTRPHVARLLTLVIVAGAITGFAAAAKVGPFRDLGAVTHPAAVTLAQTPLRAARYFPQPTDPPTIKHVIAVQDPPPLIRGPGSNPEATTGANRENAPLAGPAGSAPPAACHEDCAGGDAADPSPSGGGGGGD